jgi:enhancing lycopene biosynthesis protein 2
MKAAIIFSGCGQKDGTEVNEAILALLALDKRHIEWRGFAPDIDVNPICHLKNGRSSKEKRHVLEESARLARGNV